MIDSKLWGQMEAAGWGIHFYLDIDRKKYSEEKRNYDYWK